MPLDGSASGQLPAREPEAAYVLRLRERIAYFDRGHPFLLFNAAALPGLNERATASLALRRRVRRCLDASFSTASESDPREHAKRRSRQLIVLTFTAACRGPFWEEAHTAARALFRELCAAPTWKPRPQSPTFLDRAEIAIAAALGYDWLHSSLPTDERDALADALRRHILEPGLEAYSDPSVLWPQRWDNCTIVSNAGIMIAALATLDRYPDLCLAVVSEAWASMWRAFGGFAPDGAWPEGPSYWSLAARFSCLTVAALEASLGDSFGLAHRPGFSRTGDFALHVTGNSGDAFDFADSQRRFDLIPAAFLAHRCGRATDGWLVRDYDGWHLPFGLIWSDRPAEPPENVGEPAGRIFRGTELACFRNTWSPSAKSKPVFFAIKGGHAVRSEEVDGVVFRHGQADAGSFILDGAHARWVTDLGSDEYDLPGYFDHGTAERQGQRWRYYRTSTVGHNTLVVDGQNQQPNVATPILASEIGADCKWVILDLSAAYGRPAGTIRRGAALFGRHVVIRDEIAKDIGAEIVWNMHTSAELVGWSSNSIHFRRNDDQFAVSVIEPADADIGVSVPPPPSIFSIGGTQYLHGHSRKPGETVAELERREHLPGLPAGGNPLQRVQIRWPSGSRCLTVVLSPDFAGELPNLRMWPLEDWPTRGLMRPDAGAQLAETAHRPNRQIQWR